MKPSFCVIAPIAYLEDYATQSHTHLALAHLVDSYPEYAEFYRSMADRGDFIIMDNGAFELGQSYDPSKLAELGHNCGANAIVLPDYPGQLSSLTVNAAIEWIPYLKEEGFKVMFVPQSVKGDLEDWIESYLWAAHHPDIDIVGMSILGIPTALPHVPKSYARVVMTELLIDRGIFNKYKHHHYLGLNAGPNVEIPALLEMEALTTCDSSNPVWAGVNWLRYNTMSTDFLPINKKHLREVDFTHKWADSPIVHEAIQYNLDTTFDIFNNPAKYL